MKLTISQALGWKKTLEQRHHELVNLRNQNSFRSERLYGEKDTIKQEPMYCVKTLDKLVARVAKEIRKLDDAIKHANATIQVPDYEKDEAVLGEVELEKA
jgi:hypothetical protein